MCNVQVQPAVAARDPEVAVASRLRGTDAVLV
jgi:hypothetical protein